MTLQHKSPGIGQITRLRQTNKFPSVYLGFMKNIYDSESASDGRITALNQEQMRQTQDIADQ